MLGDGAGGRANVVSDKEFADKNKALRSSNNQTSGKRYSSLPNSRLVNGFECMTFSHTKRLHWKVIRLGYISLGFFVQMLLLMLLSNLLALLK